MPIAAEAVIHRLVLWNVDLTLVDVVRVTRAAYAEAFPAITGRPLIKLPQTAGRSESEIFFDALALNGADVTRGCLVVRRPIEERAFEIDATPRIGIRQCADWPLRFVIRGNRFVSR